MTTKIRYEGYGDQVFETEIGARPGVTREFGSDGHINDIALSRIAAVGLPLRLIVLVRADGRIDEWIADWSRDSENTYWHFDCGSKEYALGNNSFPFDKQPLPGHKPTEAQVRALAEVWLGKRKLFGSIQGGLGGPVAAWVFQDLNSPDEISRKYGDGSRVFVTRPCSDNETIANDRKTSKREADLDLACEEGKMPGAM